MANTYLIVPFRDKDAAKSLGAKWDAAQRKWYVPDGRELAPFSSWLRTGPASSGSSTEVEMAPLTTVSTEIVVNKRGISLSQLLAGVSQTVAQIYKAGVWTMVEVVDLPRSNAWTLGDAGDVHRPGDDVHISGSALDVAPGRHLD